MAVIMQHLGALSTRESELNHQLTTVTDTQRQGVLTGIELIKRLLGLRIEEEGSCPTLC